MIACNFSPTEEDDLNLRHLEVFCRVVDCESYSVAAERLIMTQPAVSMQVQAVERHFGVQLLERRNRRTILTEAGRAVHSLAVKVLKSEAETHRIVDELRHAESGRIVVGTSMTLGSHLLPPIVSRFKQKHDGAEIVVRLGERHEVCADIGNGNVDCGVLIAREIPTELTVEVLGEEDLVFICGPNHPLADRNLVNVRDLAGEEFILAPQGSSYRRVIDDLLEEQGLLDVSVKMQLDGADSVKRAVQEGLGIGVALQSGVEWELEHGLLREVRINGQRPLVEVGLVCDPRRQVSPMVRAFTEYLRDELRAQLCLSKSRSKEDVCEERPGEPARRAPRRIAHR